MSKWKDDFCENWENIGNLKRATKEIKSVLYRGCQKRQVDKDLTDVIKGKYKRKGKRV